MLKNPVSFESSEEVPNPFSTSELSHQQISSLTTRQAVIIAIILTLRPQSVLLHIKSANNIGIKCPLVIHSFISFRESGIDGNLPHIISRSDSVGVFHFVT